MFQDGDQMFCVGHYYNYVLCCFFFNDTATTEIYTLSLHDALPISVGLPGASGSAAVVLTFAMAAATTTCGAPSRDRKSTRLNSSHANISYAVFCLKKKQNYQMLHRATLSIKTQPTTYN